MKKKLDLNQLAKSIVDQAAGEVEKTTPPVQEKNAAAVELGRLGGKVRSELPPEKRKQIAKKSAATRTKRYADDVEARSQKKTQKKNINL